MMTLEKLAALMASGEFHHATYRDFGTLWEGLHIYRKENNGFNGFCHAGAFFKDNAELKQAEAMVARTGVSVGAYGRG